MYLNRLKLTCDLSSKAKTHRAFYQAITITTILIIVRLLLSDRTQSFILLF